MSSRRLAFPFRLPWHRAFLAAALPLALAGRQLWQLLQAPQEGEAPVAVSPWSLPLWALGAAAALLWLLWVLRFCRKGRVILDENALTVQHAGQTLVVPYAWIRSINLLRRAGYQWLRVEYEGGIVRLPHAMLPTGKAFDKLRRGLRHMARLTRQSTLMQATDSFVEVEDSLPAPASTTPPRRARLLLWLNAWLALTALLWWVALAWLPTAPSFDNAVRETLAQQSRQASPFGPQSLDAGLGPVCLALDDEPRPDGRSASPGGMAWHEDFIDEAARPQAQAQARQAGQTGAASAAGDGGAALPDSAAAPGRRLQQLRALADAGVLERTRINIPLNGALYPATRFRLSRQGWASSGWDSQPHCFELGWRHYLGLTGWHSETPDSNLERSYYAVRVRTGPSASQTPYWASHPAVQRAFADTLGRALRPEIRQIVLVREASGWAGQQTRGRAARSESGWKYWQRELEILYGKAQRQLLLAWIVLRGGGAPSQTEARQAIEKIHGAAAASADAQSCLHLPGHPDWPVDEELSAQPARYSVALYAQAERAPESRVVTRTLPYLQRLKELGVLHSERRSISARRGPQAGQMVEADVYELTPAMQPAQHRDYAWCLPLGEPKLDIIDLDIAPPSASYGLLPRFRYRLLRTYPHPPDWAQRSDLQARWPELRDALARGQFCEGEFTYDMARHETAGGGARCRWAYDAGAS